MGIDHQGAREFTSEELSAQALGQSGFNFLTIGPGYFEFVATDYGLKYWTALKTLDSTMIFKIKFGMAGGDIASKRNVNKGTKQDDFQHSSTHLKGVAGQAEIGYDYTNTTPTEHLQMISVQETSVIYGVIEKFKINGSYGAGYVLAYKGPSK